MTSLADRSSSNELAGKRVLVVDDGDDERYLLQMMIEPWGAEVLQAASAAEGLAVLEQGAVDLIISDIGMPGCDGYTFIEEVRAPPKRLTVPAIAITAYTRDADRARALAAGFDHHLGKPVDVATLRSLVTTLLQRHR